MRRLRHSPGQTMVMFAAFITILFGFVGLSIDVGYLLSERRAAQNAADAAALAAGSLLSQQDVPDKAAAEALARVYAARNGYGDGGASTVTVRFSPTTNPTRVAVEIQHQVPKLFVGLFYSGEWSVTSVAQARFTRPTRPYAILALDPEGPGVRFSGNNTLNVVGGSVGSNANIRFDGSGSSMSGTIDGDLQAVGTIGNASGSMPSGLTINGVATGNQGLIENPFARVTPPDCSALPARPSPTGGPAGSVVLEPGRYNGNINKQYIFLRPGVYCFMGTVQSNGAIRSFVDLNDNGTAEPEEWDVFSGLDQGGVLLYFGPSGQLRLNGAGALSIKTMGDAYKNLVLWSTNCGQGLDIQGTQDMWIKGVVYAPCSRVDLGGNTATHEFHGAVIGGSVRLHGNVTFNLTALTETQPVPRKVYLVK